MRTKQKNGKKLSIKFVFPKWVKGRGFVDTVTPDDGSILISGIIFTCVLLSLCSGVVDIVFCSGISKAFFKVATLNIASAILYTAISAGLTSGKFWCARKIGMLKELKTRLKADNITWYKNINKALIPWNIGHKFLIGLSLVTTVNMAVNSVGTAIRLAERNSTEITISIEELQKLRDQRSEDNQSRRDLARNNIKGTSDSKNTAETEADRYWPNIEEWQNRLDAIDKDPNMTVEEKTATKNAERPIYVKKAPSFVSSKNIDFISKTELISKFKETAKKNENDSEGLALYDSLATENSQEIRNTILALENHYKHPDSTEKGVRIEGAYVTFLDENGEPLDITRVIGILQGLRSEWQNNSDIGDSSQMFMILSEIIAAKTNKSKSSGTGLTEMLIIFVVLLLGFGQEYLIALFTPQANITRKIMSLDRRYLEWKDIEEKEKFLMKTFKSYKSDGLMTKAQCEALCKECVENMEDTIEDTIERYSKKNKAVTRELKIESNQDLKNYVNSALETQSEHYKETSQNLENQLKTLSDAIVNLSNNVKTIEQNQNSSELNMKKNMEEIAAMARKKVDADIIKVPTTEELKQEVEEAAKVSKPKRVKKTDEELKTAARERRDQAHMLEQAENLVKASSEATNPYTETPVPPKPQLQVFKEYDDVDASRSIENNEVRKYRFGQTTVGTAKKMGLLIDHIFDTVDPSEFTKEDLMKKEMPISEKAFNMLFERLLGLSKDETRLVEYNSAKDSYTINFDKETLKNYILEEI